MILDTNAISAWAEGDPKLLAVLRSDRPWYLPSIALGEYRYGVIRSIKRVELEQWLNAIEAACQILGPDAETAHHYAELRRASDSTPSQIPYHDIWIAALARQYGVEVVSRDTHFDRIPGIRRIGW